MNALIIIMHTKQRLVLIGDVYSALLDVLLALSLLLLKTAQVVFMDTIYLIIVHALLNAL